MPPLGRGRPHLPFHHVRLASRGTVRVHTGLGWDSRSDAYQDRRNYEWNNHGDTATLRNDRGRVVDTFSWGHHRH
ncbi:lamin tail domain-containing protein [Streptomyces sp. NPDC002671]